MQKEPSRPFNVWVSMITDAFEAEGTASLPPPPKCERAVGSRVNVTQKDLDSDASAGVIGKWLQDPCFMVTSEASAWASEPMELESCHVIQQDWTLDVWLL